VAGRARDADPGVLSQVLQGLLPVLKKRFGEDRPLVVGTLVSIANFEAVCGKQGDFSVRLQSARELIASEDRQGKAIAALRAVQGLAIALSDAGREELRGPGPTPSLLHPGRFAARRPSRR
jgi:hypothetical protein